MRRGVEQQFAIADSEPQLPHPAIDDVLSEIERLRAAGERRTADIVEFVNHHKEHLAHVQFGYLGRDGSDVLYLDKGRVISRPLETKQDARILLDYIKQRDATEGLTTDSYRLRSEILAGAHGDDDVIKSYDAYTYGTAPQHSKTELEAFLDNDMNWLPERLELHEEIATDYVEHSAALHTRVAEARGAEHPHTLYYLRGNTAAGKSTALQTHIDRYGLLLDEEGTLKGAFNVDAYKHHLKQTEAAIHGRVVVANQQVHIEGSRIKRFVQRLLHEQHGSRLNIVTDGRLEDPADIAAAFQRAQLNGAHIDILDIEAPLELSALRVLGRPVGGEDPNANFDALLRGYRGLHHTRSNLVENARERHGKGFEYLLVVADGLHGETQHFTQEQIRKMTKSELGRLGIGAVEMDDRERKLLELHMEQVGSRTISNQYISDVANAMGKWFTNGLHTVLQANIGKTLQEAVDDRSKLLHDTAAA